MGLHLIYFFEFTILRCGLTCLFPSSNESRPHYSRSLKLMYQRASLQITRPYYGVFFVCFFMSREWNRLHSVALLSIKKRYVKINSCRFRFLLECKKSPNRPSGLRFNIAAERLGRTSWSLIHSKDSTLLHSISHSNFPRPKVSASNVLRAFACVYHVGWQRLAPDGGLSSLWLMGSN